MHPIQFQSGLPERERHLARGIIETVLRAADPQRAMIAHLKHMPNDRPTHILAFGKGAIAMAAGAIEQLGDRFARATVLAPEPIVLEAQFKSKFVALYPCDHPLPTQRNIEATRELIDHARSVPEDHRVLVLISGGASAMLCSPRPRVTLGQIRQTTKDMLQRGAPIAEINTMRSQLETLKNGGLARELEHVDERFVFLLSDVIGDDPSIIASGPMHDAHPPRSPHTIIASNNTALDALAAWCAGNDIRCEHITRRVVGDAAEAAQALAIQLTACEQPAPVAFILGGEPTVDASASDGIGGPMLELGLAAALQLTATDFDWTVLTLTTDGMDGPSNCAGSIIGSSMLAQQAKREAAIDALRRHDAMPMCDTLGALIRTGPTGNNINDVAIAIRWPNNTAQSQPDSQNTASDE
jgi:glycerate 2-kinase